MALAAVLLAGGVPAGGARAAGSTAPRQPSLNLRCPSPTSGVVRHYAVSGRARLLLFWTGRHEVGRARFAASEGPGGTRRLELLIGTDPERAPRHLNRWGYVAETVCGTSAELFGVMTQTDEETADDATATLSTGPDSTHPFKTIRAVQSGRETRTEVLRLLSDEDFTYHDLDRLIDELPPPGAWRHAEAPAGTDTGFLVAITALIHQSVAAFRASNQVPGALYRSYMYGGKLYRVAITKSRLKPDLAIPGVTCSAPIESEFQIRNASGETTTFQVTYDTEGNLAEVPLRIVYHPSWWLELDLTYRPEAAQGPSRAN
jgi:hypothetical protein